jgi:uncharacterized protein YndB with AHSA1/START domain
MENIVKKHIDINATPAQVWDALTDPEKTKKFFFNARVLSDWKKESAITFKGRMFWVIPFKMTGKILEIKKEELLKYTLKNGGDKGNNFSTVTDELTFANGITTLTITDDVGSGEGVEKRYERSVKGWDKILTGLKELVEGN